MSQRLSRCVLAVSASAALSVAAFAPAMAAPSDAADPTMGVTGAEVFEHLQNISDISVEHADTGFRSVGSPGYEASSEYVEGVLSDAGYEVSRQEFVVPTQTFGTVSLSVDGTAQESFSTLSNAEGTESPLTDTPLSLPTDDAYGDSAGGELGCSPDDFSAATAGTIALVSRGECAFGDKVTNASAAGAAGVLVYNNVDGVFSGTVGDRVEGNAPAGALSGEEGSALREKIAAGGEVLGDMTVETTFEDVTTWNVIADSTTGDPENVQMLGAHLDGVAEGPGVNDNGSGTASLLATAEALAEQGELDNQVRFGFWGAEEIGLVGSTNYVESLPAEELAKIKAYMNFDMVGSENFIVGTLDSDASDVPIPDGVNVPEGSAELEKIFNDYFDSVGQPNEGTEFSGRSDYQAFIDNGIPASGLFSGADDIKTEEQVQKYGGVVGVQADRFYHSPEDTIENVSQESLDIFAPAIANSAFTLAFDEAELAVDLAADSVSVKDFKKDGVQASVSGVEAGAEVTWEVTSAKTGEIVASGSTTAGEDGTTAIAVDDLDNSAAKGLPGDYTLSVSAGDQTVEAEFSISNK